TYALAGRMAEALPLLDQTLERVATGSGMLFQALVLTELSEALLLVGRLDEASALAGRLLELFHTQTGSGYQAHAHRLLGAIAAQREPPRPCWPKPPSGRLSLWPRHSACARSRPTATGAWARFMLRRASTSRLVLSSRRLSR